jgi:hypothetical protein
MKLVVVAGIALITSFALAIGCHENDSATTTPSPKQPQSASINPDAGRIFVQDAQTPMGGDEGWAGTNQP